MKNRFGIPPDALQRIFERDQRCVYCQKKMREHDPSKYPDRRLWYTIEHLDEAAIIFNDPAMVVFCCWGCNSSRGALTHAAWFATRYCLTRNINLSTVAEPVRAYLCSLTDRDACQLGSSLGQGSIGRKGFRASAALPSGSGD